MENKKLRINVNLKTGEHIFDNDENIMTVPIFHEDKPISETMKKVVNELREEYGFSEEMISRADPILYESLLEYDRRNGTAYLTRYLNVLAKVVDKKSGESSAEYEKRAADIRRKALESAGIELGYTMATVNDMKSLSLFDKLKILKMAKKQKENGVLYFLEPMHSDVEAPEINPMADTMPEDAKSVEDVPVMEDSIDAENPVEESNKPLNELDDSKVKKPGFTERFLNAMMLDIDDDDDDDDEYGDSENSDEENEQDNQQIVQTEPVIAMETIEDDTAEETVIQEPVLTIDMDDDKTEEDDAKKEEPVIVMSKTEEEEPKTVQPKAKKAISRRQSIQASKKAMRESKKMKNLYKQKISNVSQSTKPAQTAQPQAKKTKAQKTANAKNKSKSTSSNQKANNNKNKKKHTPVVRATVIEVAGKDDKVSEKGKKENVVHRYTRKLKDKTDSIRNKVTMSKDRFKRCAAVAAVGAVAIISGIIFIPKAVASIPLEAENTSEIIIQAYDITEKGAAREAEGEEINSVLEMSEQVGEREWSASSYIKDLEVKNTSSVKEEETLAEANTHFVEQMENETLEYEELEESEEMIENQMSIDDIEANLESYLDSLTVGSRMTIDTGEYYETPEGTGRHGNFENHAGEEKIISKIGIATDEGYKSISTDDSTILELKQKYADDEISYHFVDDEGHILGWVVDDDFEDIVEQQIDDDEMDR